MQGNGRTIDLLVCIIGEEASYGQNQSHLNIYSSSFSLFLLASVVFLFLLYIQTLTNHGKLLLQCRPQLSFNCTIIDPKLGDQGDN